MDDKPTLTLSFPEENIALITFDTVDKGANVLSRPVLEELSGILDQVESRDDLHGLVIVSGKPGTFIAGADVREFVASLDTITPELTEEMCRRGQQLFARLSTMPFVTVAAIEGICVGGGTELAVWCDRRICSDHPKTEIGLPEVKLGIFPGWGGTARMPRMIGLGNAVQMITSGESIRPAEARAQGFVSDVVSSDALLASAIQLARLEYRHEGYLRDRKRWSGPLAISETELAFLGATASAYIHQQTRGQYPAPIAALETMLGSAGGDVEAACVAEAKGMAQLFGGEVNRSLLNVFFLTDRNKRDDGVDGKIAPETLRRVGVIGAGIMGSGIAASNVKRGCAVVLSDTSEEALARGARGALEEVSYDRATKSASPDRLLEFAPLLTTSQSLDGLRESDLVIEAIVENPDVKKKVFGQVEPVLRDDAILASNTSTIPITRLAEGLQRPDRFCGIHFFNPVRKMKLVEVIRGPNTSDQTVATAVAHVKRLGKFPIVCNDGPGFLVNRLLFPYMNEALTMLGEGISVDTIEKTSKKFGMPMGPLELYDMVGMDTALYAGGVMKEAFPERMLESPILIAMVEAGRLGRKSGRGFFSYQNKKKRRQPDPELASFLAPHIEGPPIDTSPEALTNRLFLPMLLEATRVLEAGVVRDARDVDLGLIFGIGFPPFKGGLLFWADRVGAAQLVEWLKPLEAIGPRFEATPLLQELATQGSTFYPSAKAVTRSA